MIGIDIVDIKRIKSAIRNPKFRDRVFSREEIAYCGPKRLKEQHYAARFAAKEAVWKALGGKYEIALNCIIVKNTEGGKPKVSLRTKNPKLKKLSIEVSLTHTKDYAAAVALIC